jgi:5-methylcytosine-specific restriction endonuclease McrA
MLRSTKPPKCKQCRRRLEQLRPGQMVHEECVEAYVLRLRAEMAERAKKVERAATRAQKEQGKGLRALLSEAQDAFNAYIRLRDANTCCVACGDPFEDNKPGGSMDAGHFIARSVAPGLRFNEDNVFGQHKNCNRPGGTTKGQFRLGVVARVGEARTLAVEAQVDHRAPKWDKDEVRSLRDTYRTKTKELKAHRSADMGVSE